MADVLKFPKDGGSPRVVIDAPASTAPIPRNTPPERAAMLRHLDGLAGLLLAAHGVLTTKVDPAQLAAVQPLVERYGALQGRVLALITRLQGMDDKADRVAVAADVDKLSADAQGFAKSVEELAQKHPRAAAAERALGAAAPKPNIAPYLVMGATVLLVGGGGYMLWRQRKAAERAVIRQNRRLAALPAPRGKKR